MRSSIFLAIAASAAIPVFVAAAPMSADGVHDGGHRSPIVVKDVLDVPHSNSNNELHSRDGFNYFPNVRDVIGKESNNNNNPPHSRDADGIPAVEVGSKPGPGDIDYAFREDDGKE
ncbi:hypothetical protein SCP_1403810 [Sparassis crispa]|uniref:Uncharacterized protein n=1 Tax=Sparassis crispa TaxID=139825 RepID=A0A401H3I8_9APHY|nr:hypothetical protein SCP_1403810 [Sparassis crispa]GBE88973.1 hypothetical protein SCP_1403810 [Sparassis crispa]